MNIPDCHYITIFSCIIALTLVGCGMGALGTDNTGAVTLDGQPIESGRIVFEPRSQGKMAVGVINQGTYQIPAERAPSAGSYLIRITAERVTGQKVATASRSLEDQVEEETYEQYIPEKYNTRSELLVELTDQSVGKHDFSLTSN